MKKLGQSLQGGLGNSLKYAKRYGTKADKLSGKFFKKSDKYLNKADDFLSNLNKTLGIDIVDTATGGVIDTDKLIGTARSGLEKGKKGRKKIKKDYDTLDKQFGTKKASKRSALEIARAIKDGGIKNYAKENYRTLR